MKLNLILFLKASLMTILIFGGNSLKGQIDQKILKTPRISQRAKTIQTIGVSTITVDYSRPSVILNGQDRTGNIWGNRAHYDLMKINFACNCEIPWRAGADENTVITFSDDVLVESQKLKKGAYGLHMIVRESGDVEVIFSNTTTAWGSFRYNENQDELRVKVKSKESSFSNLLTYSFDEVASNYGILSLKWENKEIPIKFQFDVKQLAIAKIRQKLEGFNGFLFQPLFDAANYCANNQVNQEEAIRWINRAISSRVDFFASYSVKLGLYNQLGKKEEGFQAILDGIQYANMNEINGVAYYLMQEGSIDQAVQLFEINVERNPEHPNVYDSLGEGLRAQGNDKEAIKNFKKALSLNPPPVVKENSKKNLKELGVKTN